MSKFRRNYDEKISKLFILTGLAHIPVFIAMTFVFKTEISIAIGLSLLVLAGPIISFKMSKGSTVTKCLIAFSMMCLSAIFIHMGKGMIEMHFHIFIALSSLIVFGNLLPLIVAIGTVAIHHIGFWFLFPKSLFNYEAGFEIVLLHAVLAIVQTIVCMYISKKYGVFIQAQEEIMTNLKATSSANLELAQKVSSMTSVANDSSIEQSTSIKQTAASLGEISKMVNQTTTNITNTAGNIEQSSKVANEGKVIFESLMGTMKLIDESNEEMIKTLNENNKQIGDIRDVIQIIAEKTQVINDIVFQTKLLSFNASVEAARAGEHGKGFSVVAEEVGNLANMSGNASDEINKLIESSLAKVETITKNSSDNVKRISESGKKVLLEGAQKSKESLSILEQVVHNMDSNKEFMQSVNSASHKQSEGVKDITSAVSVIDSTNHKNQEIITSLSQLSDELSMHANDLTSTIDHVEGLLSGQKKAA